MVKLEEVLVSGDKLRSLKKFGLAVTRKPHIGQRRVDYGLHDYTTTRHLHCTHQFTPALLN